jgi:hypothetical protein
MPLADDLKLARVVMIDAVAGDALRVTTFPAIGGIDRRFVGRDAFQEALALARNAAAGLGYSLVDRTGRLTPSECAALVAGRRRGAEIVPLAARRHAARVMEISTLP